MFFLCVNQGHGRAVHNDMMFGGGQVTKTKFSRRKISVLVKVLPYGQNHYGQLVQRGNCTNSPNTG